MDTAEAQERDAALREGRRAALLAVLPVLDTLERALASGSSDPEFYEGVATIQRLFMRALREAGAEAVESVAGSDGSSFRGVSMRASRLLHRLERESRSDRLRGGPAGPRPAQNAGGPSAIASSSRRV